MLTTYHITGRRRISGHHKLTVSKGKDFDNSARLENTAWRAWMKSKYKLKAISPEALNWLIIGKRPLLTVQV